MSHENSSYAHDNNSSEEGINQVFKLKFSHQVSIYLFHIHVSTCMYMYELRPEINDSVILQAEPT